MDDIETVTAPLEVVNPGCSSALAGGPQTHDNPDAGPERSIADAYLLEALTAALQIAFDAAIFPNRFEIDEQEPLSRIEALTERLIEGIENFSTAHSSQEVAKAAPIRIIDKISKRLRASIS